MGRDLYSREWSPKDEVVTARDPFKHVVVQQYSGPLPNTAHGQRTWADLVRLLLALGTGKRLRVVPDHDQERRRLVPKRRRQPSQPAAGV